MFYHGSFIYFWHWCCGLISRRSIAVQHCPVQRHSRAAAEHCNRHAHCGFLALTSSSLQCVGHRAMPLVSFGCLARAALALVVLVCEALRFRGIAACCSAMPQLCGFTSSLRCCDAGFASLSALQKTARGPHRRSNAAVEFRMSATTQFYPLVLPSVAAVHCKRLRLWIHAWRRVIIIFCRIDVGHPGGIAAFSRSAPQQCRAPARHHCGPTFLHHCSLVRRATRLWQALHALCAYTTRQPLTNHGAACLLPPSRTAVQLLSRLGRWQRRWRGRCVDARRGWGGVGWVGARMG